MALADLHLESFERAETPLFVFSVVILCFIIHHLIDKYHLSYIPECVATMFGMCCMCILCTQFFLTTLL